MNKSWFRISWFWHSYGECSFTSKSQSTKLCKEVVSTVHITSWSDGCNYVVISHIAISGNILWHLQHSILETPKGTWINGPDSILIQWLRLSHDFSYHDFSYCDLEKLGNPVPLTLQSAKCWSVSTCPAWRWTVLLLSGFSEPSTPCTLKNVQVLLDPMVVGPCARI